MRMDEGLDTGPWLAEWRIAITDTTTTGDLQPLLASEDMQEGMRSFVERRPGTFRSYASSPSTGSAAAARAPWMQRLRSATSTLLSFR